MKDSNETLRELQDWYAAQCDEWWEHEFGVSITTMDNPGWSVEIDLDGTLLETRQFETIERDEESKNWLVCKVQNCKFIAYGGPSQLQEMIEIFLAWAKTVPDWLSQPPEQPQSLTRQLENQKAWAAQETTPQANICMTDGCSLKRVSLSMFCRKHHFAQLKRSIPKTVREIWVFGSETGVAELRQKLLDRIRSIYGTEAVRSQTETGGITLTIDWMRKPIDLVLEDNSDEEVMKIRQATGHLGCARDSSEFLLPLFHSEIIEPLADTTSGVETKLNIWNARED